MIKALEQLLQEVRAVMGTADQVTALRFLTHLTLKAPSVVLDRSLRSVDKAMEQGRVRIRVKGRWFDLGGIPFALVRELYCRHIYFPDADWWPGPGDKVIDLGCNRGSFSLLCAGLGADVLAVEALDWFDTDFAGLMASHDLADRVRFLHGVVAPGSGALGLPSDQADREVPGEAIAADALLLDGPAIRTLAGPGPIALLKADVEGSEYALFADDLSWLQGVRRLAMEVHRDHGDAVALCGHLRRYGYAVRLIDKRGQPTENLRDDVGFLYAVANQA